MAGMPTVAAVDQRDPDTAVELVALQRRAYAVEAELIGYDRIPPLVESAQQLMESSLTIWALMEQGAVVGLIGFTEEPGTVDIDRIAVDPAHFRRGYARLLLNRLHDQHPGCAFVVSTGAANAPAMALYERLGYERVGERTVVQTLVVVDFHRQGGTT